MNSIKAKRMPDLVSNKYMCCGCGACAAICPKGAIAMVVDSEGFLYPKVDDAACVRCYACERVCAFKADMLLKN